MAVYGLMFVGYSLASSTKLLELEIRDTEREAELLLNPGREEKAETLFKAHQNELEKYYDQTLRHNAWIFIAGLASIGGGFAIIGLTLYLVFAVGDNTSEQIVVSSLGAVGGILSNFIAIVYLRMFSGTLTSLNEFHNRLVQTHHLHFGNLLNAKIENQDLREKTFASIAELIASGLSAEE